MSDMILVNDIMRKRLLNEAAFFVQIYDWRMHMQELSTIDILLNYQQKYGERGNDSWPSWILRKRTINIAAVVISSITDLEFTDLESALYFRCEDKRSITFIRAYESQIELAAINPDMFVKELDMFLFKTCKYIEENNLFQDFYDFCNLLELQRRLKILQGYKRLFDAYLSLLMQQAAYFCRNQLENSVIGITENGLLLYKKNPHPYIDIGGYALEKNMKDLLSGKDSISPKQLHKAYSPYGYNVYSINEVQTLEAIAKVYDNNMFVMIPYITERETEIVSQEPFKHHENHFPRRWKQTEFYCEKLLQRNYMLPVSGITARFKNAGDIEEIFFMETIRNNEMILLYRVTTYDNGEFSGFYHTRQQIFYSIFEHTNLPECHESLKNFILENYMILTCDYLIDKKKNYAIQQVDQLENEFYYPYQPLVTYTYQQKRGSSKEGSKKSNHRYIKEDYQEEVRTRSGYIRRLPENQNASDKAISYAASLGLNLPAGKTFVRSHEFRVYRKICAVKENTYIGNC